jgi:DNA-binding NtrC family response regulator
MGTGRDHEASAAGPVRGRLGFSPGPSLPSEIMEPACPDGSSTLPHDVLIVEDDAIIALDFEDTILGFGVKTVRTAASVAKALELIADRAPDFALLDVGLVHEKSFAVAERLDALRIPFVFVTGYGSAGAFPAAFARTPTLPKPCSTDALQALLKRRPNGGGAAR